jgi:hypothetical protein
VLLLPETGEWMGRVHVLGTTDLRLLIIGVTLARLLLFGVEWTRAVCSNHTAGFGGNIEGLGSSGAHRDRFQIM